ncbi:hypothetical protein L486_05317 [Kwoniella mangroviensis CBS 10435]|uniref:Choline transporter n=1 Tax=Kwoniella mangroviensis CBS 10435 TaxID=1331196 RepID=A0A1B9IQN8_9TREE|nr:hypothetical protein L486_05317 [Kwoniella mangroviensis CBS 10435]
MEGNSSQYEIDPMANKTLSSSKQSTELLPNPTTINIVDSDTAAVDGLQTPKGLDREAFGPLTAFGLAFSVINSWVVLVVGLGSGLVSGGPSALVWGFVYASICNLATVLSHGEIFAVYPSAAGQYHWAAILSPPKWRNLISWVTGMLNVIGLWLGAATAGYLAGESLPLYPTMLPRSHQCSGGNRLLDQGLMVASTLCVIAIVITLPVKASSKAPAVSLFSSGKILVIVCSRSDAQSFVFGGLENLTGWNSMVIAWLLGLLQSAFAYLGLDVIYHISEEMPNPRRDGPRAVTWTIVVSGLSGMAVLLAMLFCITDVDHVMSTPYVLPFAQICLDTTKSRAAATIFLLIPSILFMNSVRGITLTGSRVLMALGRDKVLPHLELWSITFRGEPVYGLGMCVLVPLICGLIQLGSTSTFNSLTGAATIVFEISYAVPAALMLLGGRRKLNLAAPGRTSNLGRWGVPCNLLAVFFVLQSCVIYCFPATMPVTAASMSYAVVVFVGGFAAILALLWSTWANKRYQAPTESLIVSLTDGADGHHDGVVVNDQTEI